MRKSHILMLIAAGAAVSSIALSTGAAAEDSDTVIGQSIRDVQRYDYDRRNGLTTGSVTVVRPAISAPSRPVPARANGRRTGLR